LTLRRLGAEAASLFSPGRPPQPAFAGARHRHESVTASPQRGRPCVDKPPAFRHLAHESAGAGVASLAGARHRQRSVTACPQARGDGDGGSRTHDLLVASEALCHQSFVPRATNEMRTGGVEPPQREAAGLQPVELAGAQRPQVGVAERTRTDTAGLTTPDAALHHGHHVYTGTTGLEPASSRLTSERSAQLSYAPGWGGRRDRLPATGGRDVTVQVSPEPAVAHRHSCQRVSAPPPPHRLALEAERSQLHVRARALHQPLFRHFLGAPVDAPILIARVGFEPTVSSS
jgi:hypothetical protein